MIYIYNQTKQRFIEKFGVEKFDKLQNKVNESNAIVKLMGLTVSKMLPPNATDFILAANSIFYVASKFDITVSVMAAMIMLRIWNEKVNENYHLISEQQLTLVSERIIARWI